jgi:hypothetical protein
VHWLLAANVPTQLEDAAKSAAFVPVTVTLEIVTAVVPAVSVTVSAGLAVPTFSSGKINPAGATTRPDPVLIFEINASQSPP